jgi:spore germination protein Q
MNGTYYQNPTFPGAQSPNNYTDNIETVGVPLTMEQSYIENILRLNKGKIVHIFASFPDSTEFKDREFIGTIEESGKDHIIMSNNEKNEWYLIPLIYMNYATFEDKINYSKLYS